MTDYRFEIIDKQNDNTVEGMACDTMPERIFLIKEFFLRANTERYELVEIIENENGYSEKLITEEEFKKEVDELE